MAELGERLVERVVDGVLNGHDVDLIHELLTPDFRDHDPLDIPGLHAAPPGPGSRRDVRALIDLLASPGIDFRFVLEDVFATSERVGFRIFGTGSLLLEEPDDGPLAPGVPAGSQMQRVAVPGSNLSIASRAWPVGERLGHELQFIYSCIGIYRVEGSKLAERWGRATVR